MSQALEKKILEQKFLLGSLLLAGLSVATEIPAWISFFSLTMLLWRYLFETKQVPKIPVRLTPFLGGTIFLIVFLQYNSVFGQEESIAILQGLIAILVLNYETERDHLLLVLLGFMTVVLKSVFTLDFIWLFPAALAFFGFWLTLFTNNKINKFKFLFKIFIRSIPALAILFILFPRLVVFQTKHVFSHAARSGFSDTLSPGSISQLILSDQMVFRAEFLSPDTLSQQDLYWRGAVLKKSDGLAWYRGSLQPFQPKNIEKPEISLKYKIILEPIDTLNLFVLDSPLKIYNYSQPLYRWSTMTFSLSEGRDESVQYQAESTFDDSAEDLTDSPLQLDYIQVPPLPPRTQRFINQIAEKNNTPVLRLKALERFFRETGFVYTLNPDRNHNNLDDFLFLKKNGFCEHYAAAFATLARALGIPARVVVGYQGGTYNSIGSFWRVTQKDAHAWDEVGLNGRWVRVDPTAYVSPLRVSLGAEEFFSLTPEDQQQAFFVRDHSSWAFFKSLWSDVEFFFENLNYEWTNLLLNYDLQAQAEVFRRVRGSWFYILFSLLFLSYVIRGMRKKRAAIGQHEFNSLMLWLRNECAALSVTTDANLAPGEWLRQLGRTHPQGRELIEDFLADYDRLVYAEKDANYSARHWKQKWRELFRQNKKHNFAARQKS